MVRGTHSKPPTQPHATSWLPTAPTATSTKTATGRGVTEGLRGAGLPRQRTACHLPSPRLWLSWPSTAHRASVQHSHSTRRMPAHLSVHTSMRPPVCPSLRLPTCLLARTCPALHLPFIHPPRAPPPVRRASAPRWAPRRHRSAPLPPLAPQQPWPHRPGRATGSGTGALGGQVGARRVRNPKRGRSQAPPWTGTPQGCEKQVGPSHAPTLATCWSRAPAVPGAGDAGDKRTAAQPLELPWSISAAGLCPALNRAGAPQSDGAHVPTVL